jgi:uncharacterized protein
MMREWLGRLWLAGVWFAGGIAMAQAPAADNPLAGIWQGQLKAGALEIRIVFKIASQGDGSLRATLDSPDQGAKGIPFDAVAREADNVTLEVKRLDGKFKGKLSADGRRLKGTWNQGPSALPLELAKVEKESESARPQEPKRPYPYKDEEVGYENSAAGVKLAGTLTLPNTLEPAPAVLLITGSGSQDRDESLLGHKPFLVIADYLTRRGIAVLRVDDRGVGGSTGDPSASTTEDLTGDVMAGVAYLKSRREINPRRIGLIGHSEGGIIAPLAASRSSDVAFIVLLAGTGVTGEEIIYHQGELIANVLGADAKAIATDRAAQQRLFAIVKQEPDLEKARQQVQAALVDVTTKAAGPDTAKETIEARSAAQAKAIVSPWFRFFLLYDPMPALAKVRCPVLAINGEKDLQVDPKQNLPPIERALRDGGNTDRTVKELPGLNHLFQHCSTGSPAEYGKIEETFSPEALELIGNWLVERVK